MFNYFFRKQANEEAVQGNKIVQAHADALVESYRWQFFFVLAVVAGICGMVFVYRPAQDTPPTSVPIPDTTKVIKKVKHKHKHEIWNPNDPCYKTRER